MSILATCGSSIKFHGWPEGTYMGNYELGEKNMCVRSISWNNKGTKLVAVPSNGEPIVIDASQHPDNIETPKLTVNTLNITNANTATFSKVKSNRITFGTLDGKVYVFDLISGRILSEYPLLPYGVQFLQYAADDVYLAAGCRNGQIIMYTKKNKSFYITASFVVQNSYSLSAMNCNSGYQYLLAGASKEGTMSVWDINSGNAIFIGKHHCNIVTDLAFSPSDKIISSVGLDRKFNAYDLRTGQFIFTNTLERELTSVAYAFESDEIAISTKDGQLHCYDKRNTTVPLCTFIAHKNHIKKIAFHSENRGFDFDSNVATKTDTGQEYSASGECCVPAENKHFSFDHLRTRVNHWTENLPANSSQSLYSNEFIEKKLEKLRDDLLRDLKSTTDKFSEYMNQQFIKIRREVGKRFATFEDQNEKKYKYVLSAIKESKMKSDVLRRSKGQHNALT